MSKVKVTQIKSGIGQNPHNRGTLRALGLGRIGKSNELTETPVLAGIRDVLAKSLGTTNPINMAKATVDGLKKLRRPEDVAKMRGKTIAEVLPVSAKRAETEEEPVEEAVAEPEASEVAEAPAEETSE